MRARPGHLRLAGERPDPRSQHLLAQPEPVEAVGDDGRMQPREAFDEIGVVGHYLLIPIVSPLIR